MVRDFLTLICVSLVNDLHKETSLKSDFSKRLGQVYCVSLLLDPGLVCQASGDTQLIFKMLLFSPQENAKWYLCCMVNSFSFFFFFTGLNKNSNQINSEALLTSNMVPMYQSFQGKDL